MATSSRGYNPRKENLINCMCPSRMIEQSVAHVHEPEKAHPLFNWVKLSFAQLSVATSFRRDDGPLQTLCARFKLFHLGGERPRAVKWKCDDGVRRGLPWCKNLWYLIARTEVWWLNNWLSCVRRVMDARGRLLRTRERKSRTRRQHLALIDRLARLLTPKSHYPRKNCFFRLEPSHHLFLSQIAHHVIYLPLLIRYSWSCVQGNRWLWLS